MMEVTTLALLLLLLLQQQQQQQQPQQNPNTPSIAHFSMTGKSHLSPRQYTDTKSDTTIICHRYSLKYMGVWCTIC